MDSISFEKIRKQLAAVQFLPNEIAIWIEACERGKTVLGKTGPMGHLLDRSIAIYSYHAAQARLWAIADGCPPELPHALMWLPERVRRFTVEHRRLDGMDARPAHKRIVLVAIERFMRALAPSVDRRFILDEINALPRMTDEDAKRQRLQERDALWECGLGYFNEPLRWQKKWSNSDVTRRTGAQIAALSEWAFRLQLFMDIEIWLDQAPRDHYPRPCLTRRFGRCFIEFPFDSVSDKAPPPSQPISDRLAKLLMEYIEGPREQLRGMYAGRFLWLSTKIGPLGANATYKQIVAKTEETFGLAVNPHLFRDCHATSESRSEPHSAPTAHLQLGNTPSETRSVYDHSSTREAALIIAGFAETMILKAKVGTYH